MCGNSIFCGPHDVSVSSIDESASGWHKPKTTFVSLRFLPHHCFISKTGGTQFLVTTITYGSVLRSTRPCDHTTLHTTLLGTNQTGDLTAALHTTTTYHNHLQSRFLLSHPHPHSPNPLSSNRLSGLSASLFLPRRTVTSQHGHVQRGVGGTRPNHPSTG